MRRTLVVTACVTAAVAWVWVPAASASKKPAAKKHFVPHLCTWAAGGASSLELSGTCHEKHARSKTAHTPYGTASAELFTAEWGDRMPGLVPQHTLSISALRETGSGKIIAYLEKHARLEVLEEGSLVALGKGVTATWSGDTASCENPPTGDCTISSFNAVKGGWALTVVAEGAPPGTPGAAEEGANEDDPQDLAQEELLKPATVAVGLAITNKL